MSNRKISELTSLTAVAGDDVLPIVDISETSNATKNKKITVSELLRSAPDGTAAAPAFSFESDAGNGVFLAGTDTVGISTGGTQRVTVDGSGNVTISGDLTVSGATTTVESTTVTIDDKNIELGSVASPSNTTADGGGITLKGATDKTLKWINSTGCWTFNQPMNFNDHVRIDSSGRVGIGTSSPSSGLHLSGSATSNSRFTLTQTTASLSGTVQQGSSGFAVSALGSQSLLLETNGTERMRISSSGRVLVNTTAAGDGDADELTLAGSGNSGLTIRSGTSSSGNIFFSDTTSGTGEYDGYIQYRHGDRALRFATQATERLRIDSSGRLLINHSSSISTAGVQPRLQVTGDSPDKASISIRRDQNVASGPLLVFGKSRSGALGGNVAVQANDIIGEILFNGADGTDVATSAARIRAEVDGTPSANDMPGRLVFSTTTDGSSSPTERMRIDSLGRVGIGTTAPVGLLEIEGDASYDRSQGLIIQGGPSANTHALYGTLNDLVFDTASTERMRIDDSGRVGIGTTTPGDADEGAGLQVQKYVDRNATYYSPDGHYAGSFGYTNNTQDKVWIAVDSSYAQSSAVSAGLFLSAFHQDTGGSGSGATIKNLKSNNSLVFSTVATASSGNNPAVETERLRIHGSGNVGIGTSSPQAKLDVNGNAVIGTDNVGLVEFTSTGVPHFAVAADASNYRSTRINVVSAGGYADLSFDAMGTAAKTGLPSAGSLVGNIMYLDASAQRVGIGGTPTYALDVQRTNAALRLKATASTGFIADQNSSTGLVSLINYDSGADLRFGTASTERMRINSLGNVGIGTSSPGVNGLHVRNSSEVFLRLDHSVTNTWDISNDSNLKFSRGGTERMRIDSSGRLLVGTSSAQANQQIQAANTGGENFGAFRFSNNQGPSDIALNKSRGSLGSHTILQNNDVIGSIAFRGSDGSAFRNAAMIDCRVDGTPGSSDMPGRLVFKTTADGASSPTERMHINAEGNIIGAQLGSVNLNKSIFVASHGNSGSGTGPFFYLGYSSATTFSNGTYRYSVGTNGDVKNSNNSYGSTSDIKLKENIVNANSQWSDLKALQVRNYNFKEETGLDTFTQLGVVAQEVELVSPGLVSAVPDIDSEGNDLGTVTKTVNYSVLYMKAVKALQEAMDRIETLEAKVAALEAG